MERIAILIVDVRPMFGQGLVSLFGSEPGFAADRRVRTAPEALEVARRECPDVIVWGLSFSGIGGTEVIRKIRGYCAKARIVALSLQDDELAVKSAFASGVDAYLAKEASFEELCAAIRYVIGGNLYISTDTANEILNRRVRGRRELASPKNSAIPTRREQEVLRLIAQGNSSRQIGEKLCISVKTVDTHRSNLMRKLNVHNASRLTAYAIRSGLV